MNCFSCRIRTINFQRLKLLLVSLLLFIAEYIILKQFVKLLMVKYRLLTYLFGCDYVQLTVGKDATIKTWVYIIDST